MTLTVAEAGKVLFAASQADNRQWDDMTAATWAAMLGEITLDDALAAVQAHYGSSTTWLMPGHIAALIQKQKDRNRELLHAAGPPDYPSDLTHAQEGEYRKLYQQHVKAGRSRDEATTLADDEFGAQRGHLIAAPDAVRKAINQFTADRTIR